MTKSVLNPSLEPAGRPVCPSLLPDMFAGRERNGREDETEKKRAARSPGEVFARKRRTAATKCAVIELVNNNHAEEKYCSLNIQNKRQDKK